MIVPFKIKAFYPNTIIVTSMVFAIFSKKRLAIKLFELNLISNIRLIVLV